MRGVGRAALLVGFWLLAWGQVSLPNLISGFAVAVALLIAFPPRREPAHHTRVRPLGALRLAVYVLAQLVPSNILVAREVVAVTRRHHVPDTGDLALADTMPKGHHPRRSHIRTGVLAYELEHPSDEALSLMAHVIGLTPGTMTVEATREPGVLYVHFLLLDDLDVARRSLARLERLVVDAIGGPRPGERTTVEGSGP